MWRSGTSRRRREAALAELVGAATRSGDYTAPWRSCPQVWEFFRDEGDLLRQLHRDWRTALAGAVYVAIEAGDGDLARDVRTAWGKVDRRYRGVRLILEAHADHPAIAAALRKEQALLAPFLGSTTPGDVPTAA